MRAEITTIHYGLVHCARTFLAVNPYSKMAVRIVMNAIPRTINYKVQ
jgi:hypothetical protein